MNTLFHVLTPGMQAIFQDQGRYGFASTGVGSAGSFDRLSASRANQAVGNRTSSPVIEILFGGFSIQAHTQCAVVFSGTHAEISVIKLAGIVEKYYTNHVLCVEAGDIITLHKPQYGMRAYCAVRGGFDVEPILGSASYDALSGIGPAPLSSGDMLCGSNQFLVEDHWSPERELPQPQPPLPVETLEVVLGPRDDWFTTETVASFLSQKFSVSPDSNRIGVRMIPTTPLERLRSGELASEGMVRGCIQVPPNGHPVVFGPDHPVTGGYPVIAVLTSAACDRLGQLPPGHIVQFQLA
ncbi:allophanate hydrolase subunit 2 [Corynebacterium kutscheri]|uniref:Allophanate hydrolase subunit 2 n=1 Tax=Corynebacterium kutscheri TaxID=35755 RepID=A0AB38VZI6_9CORY|nr:biotin-dependent carboxyltransferase family protein [Corynebacterium kutscheri]VEH09040.1 allophanate hydrolase subunit 2 [Corynebacterium kutscheri]VEH80173.1 allophanate hydrolase subunit 2 [Corynebacterium kutscheri]